MAMNYFTPNELQKLDATFNYKAKTGIGFGITPENEQVFITARDVEQLNLDIGDALTIYAVDNFAKPETAHFTSRWRAIRVEMAQRAFELVSAPTNTVEPVSAPISYTKPAPHPTDFVGLVDKLLQDRRPWTVNELAHAVANSSQPLSAQPDLLQRVNTRLTHMHKHGQAACLKVFGRGDQDRASAVYYAKDVDVFYDHLDTPLEGE